jgi:hypothetical protein
VRNAWKLALAAGAVAVAVILFVALRPDGDDEEPSGAQETTEVTEPETTTGGDGTTTSPPAPPPGPPPPQEIDIRIPAGGPTGIERADVDLDERVELTVRSEVADHVHVHGYDLVADVGPGLPPARIRFRATTPGSFEVELEDRGQPFLEIRVRP